SVTVEAWGAQGGANQGAGGLGGYVTGQLSVTPGEQLRIFIGGQGQSRVGCGQSGGYNGGGPTGSQCCGNAGALAGTGGGASDLRRGDAGLNDRILVAGGGGGSGDGDDGGAGGGLAGEGGNEYNGIGSGGGTQQAGGRAGGHYNAHTCSAGSPGVLGGGGMGDGNDGGGGGGGYYGGGGGANNAGGGGGSSWWDPQRVLFGGTLSGQRAGHGRLEISWGDD
ncbi:MAG: hypothetical protein CMH55_02850, partial [Myxococcales bacterium]|nr:hypothetical protein [Myxococcales bacterium]